MNDASALKWASAYEQRDDSPAAYPQTHRVCYRLRHLADRALVKRRAAAGFLMAAGLSEFTWHVVWHAVDDSPAESLPQRLADAEGFVIFLHGWDGSHAIWEDLPEAVVSRQPGLIAFVLDHNGFGATPFIDPTPDVQTCNPPAAMRTLAAWIELLRLRSAPGDLPRRVLHLVGHSMGGATLFYLDGARWAPHEQTRLALAPALLLEDELHRAFYQALGLGIGLLNRLPEFRLLDRLDDLLTPAFVEILAGGASPVVKETHETIYKTTPKGVIARTFAAMGVLDQMPYGSTWEHFHATLGTDDVLVGLDPMEKLLDKLAVPDQQVRVLKGDHYFFSVGEHTRSIHGPNRQIIIEDVLALHQAAFGGLNA